MNITKYSEKLIIATAQLKLDDPIADICANQTTLELKEQNTERAGRPRNNWWTFWSQTLLVVFSETPLASS